MRAKQYHYTMKDIADATGWSLKSLYRARSEGYIRPEDFHGVVMFIMLEKNARQISNEYKNESHVK